jgi:hypothetical protein
MRTQVRTIALAVATVVVMGALLVLFVRVRAAPEIVVPEDALSQARARYQRARGASGAAQPPEPFQADRGPAATPPPPPSLPTSADESPAVERRRRRTGALPSSGSPAAASPAPAAGSPGQTIVPQNEVRNAYDTGDFETALDLAEKRLRDHPDDQYAKRVAAVSACAMGEEAVALRHYEELTPRDKPIVARRCSRYGIQF